MGECCKVCNQYYWRIFSETEHVGDDDHDNAGDDDDDEDDDDDDDR